MVRIARYSALSIPYFGLARGRPYQDMGRCNRTVGLEGTKPPQAALTLLLWVSDDQTIHWVFDYHERVLKQETVGDITNLRQQLTGRQE